METGIVLWEEILVHIQHMKQEIIFISILLNMEFCYLKLQKVVDFERNNWFTNC